MSILESLSEAVQQGDIDKAKELTQKGVDDGLEPNKLLDDGLMQGMEVVGKKFIDGEMFIPEVLMSGEALKASVELLQPYLSADESSFKGRIVLATVAGDIHDLGKNLVGMNLTANGFEVIDLGVDIPGPDIIKAVKEHKPDYLGLSALLTTTMPEMKKVIDLLEEENIRDTCKVIIGGAPVSEEFAKEINAELYAENAIEAVDVIKEDMR